MNEHEEAAYEQGGKAVWISLLNLAIRNLGHDAPEVARLVAEREEAIAAIQRLCGTSDSFHGEHLVDIIDNHIVPNFNRNGW